MRWIVLLRGVNVGGANRLPMTDLRLTMERLGASNVLTYVQSGNVVFDHSETEEEAVAKLVSAGIGRDHDLTVPVVVRPASELVGLAETHPDVDSDIDPKFLHIVFFDRAPSSATVGAIDRDRFTPDRFVVVDRHAFVTYPNGSARSKLTIDVFERACAVTGTARNLNSVRKVADLT